MATIQAASSRPTSSHLQHRGVLEGAQGHTPEPDVISILTYLEAIEAPVGSSSRRMSAHISMARTSPSLEDSIMYSTDHRMKQRGQLESEKNKKD